MRELPIVNSLQEAVNTVIRENKKDGYNPTYFSRAVMSGDNLIQTCSQLIKSPSAYSALTDAFLNHPNLLILEDFVVKYGASWGFGEDVITEARERSEAFDRLVKQKRYE